MVRRSNFIVVPVVPSPIDIHATAEFIKELFHIGSATLSKTKIAVVANRLRSDSPSREALERFLSSLKLPYLTSISDSDNYLRAAGKGMGVFEMDEADTLAERQEYLPILKWLDGQEINCPVSTIDNNAVNVVNMEESRKFAAQRAGVKAWHSPILRKAER